MTLKTLSIAIAGAGLIGATVLSTPLISMAAMPKAQREKQADVRKLVDEIRAAVETTRARFTPGETDAEKEAAIQAAMAQAVSASGYDAITAQAALSIFVDHADTASLPSQAAENLLAIVGPQAQQEVDAAGAASTDGGSSGSGTGGGSTGSGPVGGGAGGGGGSSGYVISH